VHGRLPSAIPSTRDDVAFVEATKMEIPVASPSAGKIKIIVAAIDVVVAEGQLLGTIET
jgi:biotin carboxyl carrier protein